MQLQDISPKQTLTLPHFISSKTLVISQNERVAAKFLEYYSTFSSASVKIFSFKIKPFNMKQVQGLDKQKLEKITYEKYNDLMQTLGLRFDTRHKSPDQLLFQNILIVANQDSHGNEMRGHVLTFFYHFWPQLVCIVGFIKFLWLPEILCEWKNNSKQIFFTVQEFKKEISGQDKTSILQTKQYPNFQDLKTEDLVQLISVSKRHIFDVYFTMSEEEKYMMNLIFSSKHEEEKQQIVRNCNMNDFYFSNKTGQQVPAIDFISKQYIKSLNSQEQLMMPNVIDGLSKQQRRILRILFKVDPSNGVSEQQFKQSFVDVWGKWVWPEDEEHFDRKIYEMSQILHSNWNLRFVSKYNSSNLQAQSYLHSLFKEEDMNVVDYDQKGEPKCLLPVLPLILINGHTEVWKHSKSNVFAHSVEEVAEAILNRLEHQSQWPKLNPYWHLQNLSVEEESQGKYLLSCKWEVKQNTVIIKSLLPWNSPVWMQFLLNLKNEGENAFANTIEFIQIFHHVFHLVIEFYEGKMPDEEGLKKALQLESRISQGRMFLLDPDQRLDVYQSSSSILDQYYHVRHKAYQKRKAYLISKNHNQMQILEQKIRFRTDQIEGFFKKDETKDAWIEKFQERGYLRWEALTQVQTTMNKNEQQDCPYGYLFKFAQHSDDFDIDLKKIELKGLEDELKNLESTSAEQMWIRDIKSFLHYWKYCYDKIIDDICRSLFQNTEKIVNLSKQEINQLIKQNFQAKVQELKKKQSNLVGTI